MKHLTYIVQVLDFLAHKTRDIPVYQKHLNKMLDHCGHPPLLEKSSDSLSCTPVLEQYFTTLGCLLTQLPTQQEILKVLHAIQQLLLRPKPVALSSVKLELCIKAVELSKLPLILTQLLKTCSPEIHKKIIDIIYVIVLSSNTCCMFPTLILNLILLINIFLQVI